MTFADEIFAAMGLPVLQDQHGQAVTYQTDSGEVEVVAIPTEPATRQLWAEDMPVSAERMDFLVDAAGLAIGDQAVLPSKGHKIAWTHDSYEEVYEVMPPGADMDCFERESAAGAFLRVHAKLISRTTL